MKKLFTLLVVLLFALTLAACQEKETHDYYLTGAFAGWGDVTEKPEFKLARVKENDARIASIKGQLAGATAIYVLEQAFVADQEWTFSYKIDGTVVEFNGGQAVKVIKTELADPIPMWWAQSPESGQLRNLTPSTLYIPPFIEENVDQAGGWNDNPAILAVGTYYMVFVIFEGSIGLGAIAK